MGSPLQGGKGLRTDPIDDRFLYTNSSQRSRTKNFYHDSPPHEVLSSINNQLISSQEIKPAPGHPSLSYLGLCKRREMLNAAREPGDSEEKNILNSVS